MKKGMFEPPNPTIVYAFANGSRVALKCEGPGKKYTLPEMFKSRQYITAVAKLVDLADQHRRERTEASKDEAHAFRRSWWHPSRIWFQMMCRAESSLSAVSDVVKKILHYEIAAFHIKDEITFFKFFVPSPAWYSVRNYHFTKPFQ
ncbi:hypothetical protein TNCV_899651 [Trichonephila clavipes]|nr:hypothetical protein TNCV_899651 [Trichonephila clavipes]